MFSILNVKSLRKYETIIEKGSGSHASQNNGRHGIGVAINRYHFLHIASSNLSRTIHLETCFLHLPSKQFGMETIFIRKPAIRVNKI